MIETKQNSVRGAGLIIRPLCRFLLLRSMGRCRVAGAWEQKSPALAPQAQAD